MKGILLGAATSALAFAAPASAIDSSVSKSLLQAAAAGIGDQMLPATPVLALILFTIVALASRTRTGSSYPSAI
ncbi:hypothetical protein [Sphingomonas sp. ID0503]|uniref:hypothetical protein n=1 Tax=Sphingomonas sp. ID0503 TaxID=3399691 RepID=UPI003AFB0DB0